MNKLILISDKGLVSAKELYLGLELNKTNWSRWYPKNIEQNEYFEENTDWIGARHNDEGNETMDFAISLEFAKHIAMMARTGKSHEYRNYFIECEKKVIEQLKPTCIEDILITQLQEMKSLKNEVQAIKQSTQETKEEIQGIREITGLSSVSWKTDSKNLIVKIAHKLGGNLFIQDVYKEIYTSLEKRIGCQLEIRLTNKRRRMADEGVCKSKRDKLNKLDIIGEDKKILECFLAIVKELAIKYGV